MLSLKIINCYHLSSFKDNSRLSIKICRNVKRFKCPHKEGKPVKYNRNKRDSSQSYIRGIVENLKNIRNSVAVTSAVYMRDVWVVAGGPGGRGGTHNCGTGTGTVSSPISGRLIGCHQADPGKCKRDDNLKGGAHIFSQEERNEKVHLISLIKVAVKSKDKLVI